MGLGSCRGLWADHLKKGIMNQNKTLFWFVGDTCRPLKAISRILLPAGVPSVLSSSFWQGRSLSEVCAVLGGELPSSHLPWVPAGAELWTTLHHLPKSL